jgi:hypothetical protein
MFPCGEEAIVERLVKSREPIAIWCAGLRTLQVFAKTRLSEANIKMIIDGDPQKYGQKFCGYTVRKPDDVASFDGTIVIMHASSPEKIKKHICSLGVANRIIIV